MSFCTGLTSEAFISCEMEQQRRCSTGKITLTWIIVKYCKKRTKFYFMTNILGLLRCLISNQICYIKSEVTDFWLEAPV